MEQGDQQKRRYRFLNYSMKHTSGEDKMYQQIPAHELSPEERDKEIKLRWRSMQRLGQLPCLDPASLNDETVKAMQEEAPPPVKPSNQRHPFVPKAFKSRR